MSDIRNRITEIRKMRLGDIAQGPDNWRLHPKTQVAAFLGLVEEVGWFGVPLIYWSEKEASWAYLDGNMRGENLPDFEADVGVTDFTDEDIAEPLTTYDPIAAQATADREKLGALLGRVRSGNEGVQALLAGVFFGNGNEPPEDPGPHIDKAAELQEKWQVSTGDLWVIPSNTADGEHQMICGDCTDGAVVEKIGKINLILTDPPYGMRLDTDYTKMPDKIIKPYRYEKVIGDDTNYDPTPILAFYDYCKEQFWWGADYYCWYLPHGGSWVVWDKRNEKNDDAIGSGFELCWSKTPHKRKLLRYLWSGLTARDPGEKRMHPTQKPVAMFEEIIGMYSKVREMVADFYFGSGTTLIACERLARLGRGVEIHPPYVSVALQRLADMGLEPRRVDKV